MYLVTMTARPARPLPRQFRRLDSRASCARAHRLAMCLRMTPWLSPISSTSHYAHYRSFCFLRAAARHVAAVWLRIGLSLRFYYFADKTEASAFQTAQGSTVGVAFCEFLLGHKVPGRGSSPLRAQRAPGVGREDQGKEEETAKVAKAKCGGARVRGACVRRASKGFLWHNPPDRRQCRYRIGAMSPQLHSVPVEQPQHRRQKKKQQA